MRLSRHHVDRPVLITEAPVNVDDEFDRRRKRYLLMMLIRALCIVGAACTFHISGWLAAVFVAAALVLPWSAVLIANDGPPKRELRFRRFVVGNQSGPRELTGTAPPTPDERADKRTTGPDEQPSAGPVIEL